MASSDQSYTHCVHHPLPVRFHRYATLGRRADQEAQTAAHLPDRLLARHGNRQADGDLESQRFPQQEFTRLDR